MHIPKGSVSVYSVPAHLCQKARLRQLVERASLLGVPGALNNSLIHNVQLTACLAPVVLRRGWFAVDFLSTFPFAFVILACLDGGGCDTAIYRYWALLQLLAMARLPLKLM